MAKLRPGIGVEQEHPVKVIQVETLLLPVVPAVAVVLLRQVALVQAVQQLVVLVVQERLLL